MKRKKLQNELKITTPRLLLWRFRPKDVTEKYVKALEDPEVIGLTESRYRTKKMTIQKAKEYARKSTNKHSMLIGIFIAKTKQHIGNIRLHTISSENKRAELGIMIWDKSEWGKGYATESLNAVVNYAFNTLKLHKVEAEYYSINEASARLFEKAVFTIEGIIKDHFFVNGKFVDAIRVGIITPNQ